MSGSYLMDLIEQDMTDLGYPKPNYRFKAVRVKSSAAGNFVNLQANNEYYYLVAKTVPASLKIVSDSGSFYEGTDYPNFNFYCIKKFTGSIRMTATIAIDLEFIRVIPRINKKAGKQ